MRYNIMCIFWVISALFVSKSHFFVQKWLFIRARRKQIEERKLLFVRENHYFYPHFWPKTPKNAFFRHFFAKIFGGMKKKQYLCTRFRKKGIKLTRSRQGYSGNRPYCRAGNRPEVFWKGTPENSRLENYRM